MEKSIKIILFVVLGIVVINVVALALDNSNSKEIKRNLENAKRSADSALTELQFAKTRLDSIQSDMLNLKQYVNNIQNRVEKDDLSKILTEKISQQKKDSIQQEINALKQQIATDTLPTIVTKRLSK